MSYNLFVEEIAVLAPKLPRVWILLTPPSVYHLTHSPATCSVRACLIQSGDGPFISGHLRSLLRVSITDDHPLARRSSVSAKWWHLIPSVLPSTTIWLLCRVILTATTWQCFFLSLYYFPEKWVSSLSFLQRSAIRVWVVFFFNHISWILNTLMWLNLLWSLSSLTRQAGASPSLILIRNSIESPKNLSWLFWQDYNHLWCFLVFWFDNIFQGLWSLEKGTNTSHVF